MSAGAHHDDLDIVMPRKLRHDLRGISAHDENLDIETPVPKPLRSGSRCLVRYLLGTLNEIRLETATETTKENPQKITCPISSSHYQIDLIPRGGGSMSEPLPDIEAYPPIKRDQLIRTARASQNLSMLKRLIE
jgi:hypothetical protein